MSLKAGRVGVNPADVDPIDGHISPSSLGGYTKEEADAKFETQTAASSEHALLQPKRLSVPVSMLDGSKLTVESVLGDIKDNMTFLTGYPTHGKAVLGGTEVTVDVSRKMYPSMELVNGTYLVVGYDFSYSLPNNFIIAFMSVQNTSYTIKKIIESSDNPLSLSIARVNANLDRITLSSETSRYMNLLVYTLPIYANGF